MKKLTVGAILVLLALLVGCGGGSGGSGGGGGNGGGGGVSVSITPSGTTNVAVTLTQQFTATVSGTSNTAVTWSVSGSGCSMATCGTISSNGLYTAPAAVPNPNTVTVTATSNADSTKSGSATVKIIDISVVVSPNVATVSVNGTQAFNAVATPAGAPQTVTWTLAPASGTTCSGSTCGTVSSSGIYTAPASLPAGNPPKVTVTATSTADAAGKGSATITLVSTQNSRVQGTYTLRFSGFNATGAVLEAGNFGFNGTGGISGGTVDVSTSSGVSSITVTGGTYTVGADGRGGMMVSSASATFCYLFAVGSTTVDNPLIIQVDAWTIGAASCTASGSGLGTHGSGVMNLTSPSDFNNSALNQPYVFGTVGADANGKRVAYVGQFAMDGAGHITSGSLDINDAGIATTVSTLTGTYNVTSSGAGTLALTANGTTFNFNLYVKDNDELQFISTDPVLTHPRVVGFAESQDTTQAYDSTTFNANSVFYVTGVDASNSSEADAAIGVATTDGAGNLTAIFDSNNAGTITSNGSFSGTYSASPTGGGRYTISLNGVTYVLYAITANKGFLLDQSSASVLTGLIEPQTTNPINANTLNGSFIETNQQVPTAAVQDEVAALLLNGTTGSVSGTLDQQLGTSSAVQNVSITGTYTVSSNGRGSYNLTTPAANRVLYVIGTSKFAVMDVDPSNTSPAILITER